MSEATIDFTVKRITLLVVIAGVTRRAGTEIYRAFAEACWVNSHDDLAKRIDEIRSRLAADEIELTDVLTLAVRGAIKA